MMGILNVTPDSFSDGGVHDTLRKAVVWAEKMRADGADIIDVGGESTRPGFDENCVSLEEERRRVLPVVAELVSRGMTVSVDTSKPEIMREAADAGAAILNDVRASSVLAQPKRPLQPGAGLLSCIEAELWAPFIPWRTWRTTLLRVRRCSAAVGRICAELFGIPGAVSEKQRIRPGACWQKRAGWGLLPAGLS